MATLTKESLQEISIYHKPHDELAASLNGVKDFSGLAPALSVERYSFHPLDLARFFDEVFSLPVMLGIDRIALFAAIKKWALAALVDGPLKVIPMRTPENPLEADVREFKASVCRGILSNAFLGNVRDIMATEKRNKGGIDFRSLIRGTKDDVGMAKIAALLLYFEAARASEGTSDDDRTVRFERIRTLDATALEVLLSRGQEKSALNDSGDLSQVNLHSDGMENTQRPHSAFVNFANADFGFGCFIPSCTQEEILQVSCPEFNVGMIIIGRMEPDEVVNVGSVRRYSSYTGYLDSYSVGAALSPPSPPFTILTLDATTHSHLSRTTMLRDIGKAHAAFSRHATESRWRNEASMPSVPVVSTGRWGCGVFGGMPCHKFLQQVIAAKVAGVELEFSTFGTPDGCDSVLAALRANATPVSRAWDALCGCEGAAHSNSGIEERLLASLASSSGTASSSCFSSSTTEFSPKNQANGEFSV